MGKQDLLKTQTCILRVNIDCDGCKRKVRKILQKIDGVYATAIDMQQGKVTVTGDVEPDVLIKKLEKSGKHAELWSSGKGESKNKNSELDSVNDQLKKLLQMGQGKNEVIKEKGGKDQQKGGVIGGGDGKNLQQVNFQQLLEQMRSGSKDFTIKDHKPVKVDLPSEGGGGGSDDDDFEDFSGDESYDDDDDDEYDDDDEFDEDEDYDDDEFDEDDDDEGDQQKTSMAIMGNGHGKDKKGGDNGGGEKAKKGGGNNDGENGNEGKKGGGPKSGGEGKNRNKSGSGGGGGGGGKNGGFQDINVPHHKGGGGGGMGPMGHYQVGPMGHYQVGPMGQQVMNMNGGGGGYYQGGMGPMPNNPYHQQQQQYMAMMNQQRMMNGGGGGYHPAMYGRPPPGYGYVPPPAYNDHITHMFSDENPGSCSIM